MVASRVGWFNPACGSRYRGARDEYDPSREQTDSASDRSYRRGNFVDSDSFHTLHLPD